MPYKRLLKCFLYFNLYLMLFISHNKCRRQCILVLDKSTKLSLWITFTSFFETESELYKTYFFSYSDKTNEFRSFILVYYTKYLHLDVYSSMQISKNSARKAIFWPFKIHLNTNKNRCEQEFPAWNSIGSNVGQIKQAGIFLFLLTCIKRSKSFKNCFSDKNKRMEMKGEIKREIFFRMFIFNLF